MSQSRPNLFTNPEDTSQVLKLKDAASGFKSELASALEVAKVGHALDHKVAPGSGSGPAAA